MNGFNKQNNTPHIKYMDEVQKYSILYDRMNTWLDCSILLNNFHHKC